MHPLLKTILAATLVLSSATGVHAQAPGSSASASASADEAMSHGEVKKVDKSAGKITIRHGPLRNLGMDGMTMVFRVADPAMLDQVRVGDRIDFIAEQPDGKLTVMKLEKQH